MTSISEEQIRASQEKYLKKKNLEECSICYTDYVHIEKSLPCKHYVCDTCIYKLDTLHCPFCRTEITAIREEIKTSIATKEKQRKELSFLKDQVTSQYLGMYPRADINTIYTALTVFEDPTIILTLSPKELKWMIQQG